MRLNKQIVKQVDQAIGITILLIVVVIVFMLAVEAWDKEESHDRCTQAASALSSR